MTTLEFRYTVLLEARALKTFFISGVDYAEIYRVDGINDDIDVLLLETYYTAARFAAEDHYGGPLQWHYAAPGSPGVRVCWTDSLTQFAQA